MTKPALMLKEYGRNFQKLVEFLGTIEDKEKRTAYTTKLVDMMQQTTFFHRDKQLDNTQKLWNDLYTMSNYNADLESEFPMCERKLHEKRPKKVDYQNNQIKYKHYGKNIELLIEKAMTIEGEKEREDAIVYIGRLMKSFYSTWNKDFVEDRILVKQIEQLSNGKLKIDTEKVISENLFEPLFKERKKPIGDGSRQGSGHKFGEKSNNNRSHQKRRRNN